MASKLFYAVVGLGIALGGTAGCGGRVYESDTSEGDEWNSPPDDDASRTGDMGDGGTSDAQLGDVWAGDVQVEDAQVADAQVADVQVEPTDASVDGASDADIEEAFCDTTWPTTKGLSNGCYEEVEPGMCSQTASVWCDTGQWKCPDGLVRGFDCKCWEGMACE